MLKQKEERMSLINKEKSDWEDVNWTRMILILSMCKIFSFNLMFWCYNNYIEIKL